MFGKLRNRGKRFINLLLLILTVSGAVLMATPGPASAQRSYPPNDPVNCSGLVCRYLVSSTTEFRPVTTTQECNLGWSSRKAMQDVTTTQVYQVDLYRYEYWTLFNDGFGGY